MRVSCVQMTNYNYRKQPNFKKNVLPNVPKTTPEARRVAEDEIRLLGQNIYRNNFPNASMKALVEAGTKVLEGIKTGEFFDKGSIKFLSNMTITEDERKNLDLLSRQMRKLSMFSSIEENNSAIDSKFKERVLHSRTTGGEQLTHAEIEALSADANKQKQDYALRAILKNLEEERYLDDKS